MKSIIIASTSTIHGSGYLEYLLDELENHFKSVNEILFIPYARPGGISHDAYTEIASKAFKRIEKTVKGIHEFDNAENAIKNAEGIFVGGGNTFVLVSQLYKNKALAPIKTAVTNGIPYLGTSAGSNICGLTMNTTNDMPIMYPPSFKTLGLVPFNINPHYLDPIVESKHMGETRETRIKEFHAFNNQPVIGLREGSWIAVENDLLTLKGTLEARIFECGKTPYEIETNSDLAFLK
ncbi:dipeptidase PepE [Winogradskyella litoriviva]|uniref:Dipeptidase PepE n=1 Tax=Winogradskyella litoriviva TaxID=1220182 RepID=A0ABX2E4D2_9FLAO|nr:dipeptidase PepE [Winogradskyella litoriviva]NRD23170.1 dipeptidase PepE [Winogradskyella litoriviva]